MNKSPELIELCAAIEKWIGKPMSGPKPSGSVGGLSLGSVSFAAERILRVSESKENEFSLPNVSKMPKGNGTDS